MLVDFHNHILPGVDDGARDPGETRAAIRVMYDAGVRLAIASPHLTASVTANPDKAAEYQSRISRALDDARRIVAMEQLDLTIEGGAEVMLDDANVSLSNASFRLAGTGFVLVEFSLFGVPPNAADMLFRLRAQGWQPVLGHPERYNGLALSTVEQWHSTGTLLQVNAGSLLGDYGPYARRAGWELLRAGLIQYICSDYHARGKFRLPAALDALEESGGRIQAELLVENARRLSRDEMPIAVPPLRREPWYRSIFRRT